MYPADITLYVYIFRGSLQPDSSYTLDVDVNFIIGKIQEVKFVWNKTGLNLSKPQLGASRITVQSGADGTECVSLIPPKS